MTATVTARPCAGSAPRGSACGTLSKICCSWPASMPNLPSPSTSLSTSLPWPALACSGSPPWRSQKVPSFLCLPTGADALIEAPPEWVDRLFGVLIDNACRYAGDGGSVTVTVSSSAKLVTLAVQDSGPGIPPEQRPFLFDRFHRGSNGGEGAGLGLAIADAVVRSTDGKWRVGDGMSGGAHIEVSWRRLYGRDNFSARHHRRRAERPQDVPLDLPQLQDQ